MKKTIIYIGLLFLMTGLVNAALIDVYEPFAKPTLNNVTITGSGTGYIAAGNYQFAIKTSDDAYIRYKEWTSPMSNIINLTVPANSKVTFNFNIPNETRPPEYVWFFFSKDGSRWYTGGNYNLFNYYTINGDYEINLSQELERMTTSTYFSILENWDYYDESYFGLNTSIGTCHIEIGADGDFDTQDIISALQSSSLIEGEHYLITGDRGIISTCSFEDYNNVGEFDSTESFLMFWGGMYFYGTGITWYNGRSSIAPTTISSGKRSGYNSNFYLYNSVVDAQNIIFTNIIRGSAIESGSGISFTPSSGSIKGSYFVDTYTTVPIEIEKTMMTGYTFHRFWDNDPYFDIDIYSRGISFRTSYNSNLTEIRVSDYDGGYQINFDASSTPNTAVHFYDVDFYDALLNEKIPLDEISIYDGNHGYNSTLHMLKSLNVNTALADGSTLSNVSLIMYDKDDNVVINTTSNENGTIKNYVEIRTHQNNGSSSSCTDCGIETYHYPFTIQFSKEGYVSQELILNMTDTSYLTAIMSLDSGSGSNNNEFSYIIINDNASEGLIIQ